MRRRFCGGTSHISDMLENGIWVITLYEGIIKGDRYDNRFITPGMICVIEDNIRFCYREFNVQDYTPIKWIEGVSRIPDIPYVGDKDLARLDYDGKGNSRRIMELYGDYNTAAKNLYDTQQWSYVSIRSRSSFIFLNRFSITLNTSILGLLSLSLDFILILPLISIIQ